MENKSFDLSENAYIWSIFLFCRGTQNKNGPALWY